MNKRKKDTIETIILIIQMNKRKKDTIETIILIILIIFTLYMFVGWIFPAMCNSGITGLCGI
ncbi:MAG: hypothetical protein QXP36_15015 [Conexivisphaerales archaeon]